jgi:hypothetical protein
MAAAGKESATGRRRRTCPHSIAVEKIQAKEASRKQLLANMFIDELAFKIGTD